MLFTIPNLLTLIRLLGSVSLIWIKPMTRAFFVVYTVCGLTDALDGFIARKTNTVTDFGAKLDSVADLAFYGVMLVRIFGLLWKRLPRMIWIIVGLVIAARIFCYIYTFVRRHRFSAMHTLGNKLSGLMVFLIPYMYMLPIFVYYAFAVVAVTVIATAWETVLHLTGKDA